MKIDVLSIGQKMPSWVDTVVKDYQKRIHAPFSLDFINLPLAKRGLKTPSKAEIQKWKLQEAQTILKRIQPDDYIIALDERGKSFSTIDFAKKLQVISLERGKITLIIGGPDGLDDSICQRANLTLALSEFTFAHPLVRVVLAEQLYRCISVIQGHPYHRQ